MVEPRPRDEASVGSASGRPGATEAAPGRAADGERAHPPIGAAASIEFAAPLAARAGALAAVIAGALGFRAACYAVMTAVAVWAERRPAPGALPDLVLSALPYREDMARANYLLWLGAYLPLSLLFLAREPRRWARYMVTGGLVSLARGATIALTGLGPPDPSHAGPGLGDRPPFDAWLELISPWGVFARGTAQAYLTKDLFFSGHTATTFLLVLYLWPWRRLRWVVVAAHLAVVANVLLARLHYAIDVVGAWAVTFAIFALREGWARRPVARRPPDPGRWSAGT